MKKVLFIATVVKTHIMEFHVPYLKMFKEKGWETAVAARNDYENPTDCVIPYCDTFYDIPFERNPFKPGNIEAYKNLKKLIDEGAYDIIHCHTPVGAMLTRLAAADARKKGSKVFYTAHGFHFYTGAPLINWLLYYPVEKALARKTDVLITINKEDYERAKTFKAGRVVYIPGVGIDVNKFKRSIEKRNIKRCELGLSDNDYVLLSVGELIKRKNHAAVLEALSVLKKDGKLDRIQYLICGRGILADELKQKAETLGISEHVHFLGYRSDIAEICSAADVFVFPSHQEGLPVAVMEAMAAGLPIIAAKIRGVVDLLEGSENQLVEYSSDVDAYSQSIGVFTVSKTLCERIGRNNQLLAKDYDIENVKSKMQTVYGMW